MNKGAYKDESREFLTKLINMLPERSLGKTENEMKSSKDAEKRYDDMKQFFSTRRQDRGDRVERVEKVADYLKNLNIDSEDESMSEDEEEFKGTQGMKKNFEGFGGGGGGKMNSFLKKNKMDESLSSSETSSTLSLSDLSLDSEEEEDIDDEIVKDPFGKKKSEKNQKVNKLRKPKYEDLDKTAKKGEMSGLMDTLMNYERKTSQEKKNKNNPDKIKQASGKTNMRDLQKQIDKKLTKLSEQNGPTMDMAKTKKNKKPTNSSGSSDLSPEEEFFRYLQGTKGKKMLESIGKKVDVNPNTKTSLEESLAEFSRSGGGAGGGRTSAKMSAKPAQSTKVTEPSRPAPTKKIAAKEPTIAKLPDIGMTKTGTIAKIPTTKDINTKTKMTIAAKDPTKLSGSSKDAKVMLGKLETKPERPEAGAKKAIKKAPTKK